MKLWKNLTYFVAFPAVAVMTVNVYLHMKEEWDNPPPRPEFIPYEHLRIRTKVLNPYFQTNQATLSLMTFFISALPLGRW